MSLKQQAISAGRWTTASTAATSLLKIVQVMVLARLLQPSEFGLMAVTTAMLAVVGLFADFGVNRVIIHKDLTSGALSSLFWFNILASSSLAFALAVLSPVVALLYRDPALTGVIALSALALPISGLGAQLKVLAAKALRFRALALNETLAALVGFCGAVLLAIEGAGVYALVGASLASALTSTLLAWIWLADDRKPGWRIRLRGIRNELGMGGYLVGQSVTGALQRESDIFIGGALAGPTAVGLLAVPRDLTLRLANTLVNPVVTQVGLPVMAKAQGDRPLLRRIYLTTLRMTSSMNCPLYVMLALFAHDTVQVLYGPRWVDSVFYLQVLAAWGLVRSVGNPVGSLIIAVGRARLAFVWNMALLGLTVPVLWYGARGWGLTGLVWTMLAIQIAVVLPAWRFLVFPLCGARLHEYLAQLAPGLLIAVCSGAFGLVAAELVDGSLARLVVGGSAMAVVYLSASYRLNKPWFETMIAVLRADRQSAGGLSRDTPAR